MVIETPFSLRNGSGDAVRGDLRYPSGADRLPLLLVCHGFTAHKDWGPFPYFGSALADLGFATAVFNFSHNGMGEDPRRMTELEKFSRNTVGDDLEDLRALVDAAVEGSLGGGLVDSSRLGIVGHSRGGGIAILAAGEDGRIRGVASWAGVATFHRYTAHQKEMWEKQGYLPVHVRGARTRLRLSVDVLHDLESGRERYDILRAARTLRVPLLIVHGEADVSVRTDEALALRDAADPGLTTLVRIPRTGHTFGAGHPLRGDHPTLDELTALTARWFHGFL